jgi:hypothetical protein
MRGMPMNVTFKGRAIEQLDHSRFETVEAHTRHCLIIIANLPPSTNAFITLRSGTLLALPFFVHLRLYL